MKYDRGGLVLKTGKIGRMNILRQQILLPGETMRPKLRGTVRLTGLRERESVRIHARVDAFIQPLRWLWPELPQFLAAGPAGFTAPLPATSHTVSNRSTLGIGGNTLGSSLTPFFTGPMRIFNEWYKWPEDPDITHFQYTDGPKCVNLAHSFTRIQANDGPLEGDTAMITEASGTREQFDIRALAELQARYRLAIDQDWIAHGRYVDLLKELWGEKGSREVDKVPMRLDGAQVGVDPRNLYATNAEGLGAVMSIYNFNVNHDFGSVSMPEHCLLTYVMLVRFSPVATDEINPLSVQGNRSWEEVAGHAGMLAAKRPVAVRSFEIVGGNSTQHLGYLPAGWQWRARWNCIGDRVDDRGTFPILQSLLSNSATTMRDPTAIGEPFRSASLGDYICDLDFDEKSMSPVPGPKSSLYSGAGDSGRGSSYPYPGPRRVV